MYTRSVTVNNHTRPAPICIDMLEDDANDSGDQAEYHDASVSVNKKRFKYVMSYASSLVFLLFAHTSIVLPTCTL